MQKVISRFHVSVCQHLYDWLVGHGHSIEKWPPTPIIKQPTDDGGDELVCPQCVKKDEQT